MEFVIISGLSGAGKSNASRTLEDMGFYCVDNLPVDLIRSLRSCASPPRGAMRRWP